MWYDHGGENEAMLTIQQLYGNGYRWRPASNGLLYYATDGQNWSWNEREANGDNFNINELALFNLDGHSLGEHPVDELLRNFNRAQFYRARGSHAIYKWRDVIMRSNEYLAVYDRVTDDQAQGKFQWVNKAYGYDEPLSHPDIITVRSGPGDQLHLVSPTPIRTQTKPYGTIVNERDHVIFTSEPTLIDEADLQFHDRTGLAAPGEVYLFEGDSLVHGGFGLIRQTGNFSAGAWQTSPGVVEGRVVGHEGGQLAVKMPQVPKGRVSARVAGKPVEVTLAGTTVSFEFEITGADGYKPFDIRWTP